ncbi:MAG: flagellar biosynthesis protein FlhB [Desulfovibrionaceae bacterium]|nr:flagellar biosynthesis protein FlhB [Desulfovibrionaceae bacterium]MBF0512743.1 flagellar biosynthesis protein FlhB [Desulfovibrionaceae bacterium]
MAERDPEKTEKATPKRTNKAREQGSVPKSAQLSKTVVLIAGYIALRMTFGTINAEMSELWRWSFGPGIATDITPERVMAIMFMMSKHLAAMLLPLLLFVAAVAYVTLRLQVGSLWQPKIFKPDWSKVLKFNFGAVIGAFKLDPRKLFGLGRQLGQATIIGFAPYLVLKKEFPNFPALFYYDAPGLATYFLGMAQTMMLYSFVPMVLIAAADTWWSFHDYNENLKMSKFEVKDEHKQAEGDPQVKIKQRQNMMKFMQLRMIKQVPKADVIITNPTHFAVALRYHVIEAAAPVVLAKGADHMAERIKEIAREHNIPIRENKPLARALYKDVEVGEMIPEELYQAVATLLAQLPKFKRQQG